MRVLSLFDGISCARVAMHRLKIPVDAYYASEIDDQAMLVSKRNWSDVEHIGNVEMLRGGYFENIGIDLLIGGSPCQDLSIAKAGRLGLAGGRSKLFWEYVRMLDEAKPRYFILENVASMSAEDKAIITDTLGVEPVLIDANAFSAQNRRRYFWTNIPGVTAPEQNATTIRDILEPGIERQYLETPRRRVTKTGVAWDKSGKGYASQQDRAYYLDGKHPTIPTSRTMTKINVVMDDDRVARLTFTEVERLQGLPDGYTADVKNIERRGGVIGNAFNVDVIAHILSFIPEAHRATNAN